MFQKIKLFTYLYLICFFILSFSTAEASGIWRRNTVDNESKITLRKRSITKLFRQEREEWRKNKGKNVKEEKVLQRERNKKIEKKLLITQEEHLEFLKNTLVMAEKQVIISSPAVSTRFIDKYFINWLKEGREGLKVTVYTSIKGGMYLEEKLQLNQTLIPKKSIEIKPIESCRARLLIMDDTLFISSSFDWLFKAQVKVKNIYLTSVIQGKEAKPLITRSLNILEKAVQNEKDRSLVNAEEIVPLELQEDVAPREIQDLNIAHDDASFLRSLPLLTNQTNESKKEEDEYEDEFDDEED
jgi:hypothetical protein